MAGRGRPKSNDSAILAEINKNPEKLKSFQAYIENIQHYLREQASAAEGAKDVIADAAEKLGLSKGYLKKTANADLKDSLGQIVAEAEAIEEGIDLLKKHENVSDSEGSDDSF